MQYYNDYYGGAFQPYPSYDLLYRREEERKKIKKLSITAGLCVTAFAVLQFAFSFVLALTGLNERFLNDRYFAFEVNIVYYLTIIFLPFLVAFLMTPVEERPDMNSFGKPRSNAMILPAVICGFMFCMIGNFATDYLISFLERFHIELSGGEYETSADAFGLVSNLITIAVLPALIEEFSLRFVVMQPLRKYGDKFAIVMSSMVFALMHGNMVQIPFAFIAGVAIAYFVISTGSVWTGVLIHLLNNAYSVVINYMLEVRPTAAETFYRILLASLFTVGVICGAVYLLSKNRNRLENGSELLTIRQKTAAYIFTLPMIIAIVLLFIETSNFVTYTG
ncbi:MAG: CPBP family intramembrane metalloprotease [Clostridiales bacterium]|nr:CPBP family intramembrane metalloprotease [Clostridiales bacterium]